MMGGTHYDDLGSSIRHIGAHLIIGMKKQKVVLGERFLIKTSVVILCIGVTGLILSIFSLYTIVMFHIVVVGLAGLTTACYLNIRRQGLLNFLPRKTQELLKERSLLKLLIGEGSEDQASNFWVDIFLPLASVVCLPLEKTEILRLVSALPVGIREKICQDGLVHFLPKQIQGLLLPDPGSSIVLSLGAAVSPCKEQSTAATRSGEKHATDNPWASTPSESEMNQDFNDREDTPDTPDTSQNEIFQAQRESLPHPFLADIGDSIPLGSSDWNDRQQNASDRALMLGSEDGEEGQGNFLGEATNVTMQHDDGGRTMHPVFNHSSSATSPPPTVFSVFQDIMFGRAKSAIGAMLDKLDNRTANNLCFVSLLWFSLGVAAQHKSNPLVLKPSLRKIMVGSSIGMSALLFICSYGAVSLKRFVRGERMPMLLHAATLILGSLRNKKGGKICSNDAAALSSIGQQSNEENNELLTDESKKKISPNKLKAVAKFSMMMLSIYMIKKARQQLFNPFQRRHLVR